MNMITQVQLGIKKIKQNQHTQIPKPITFQVPNLDPIKTQVQFMRQNNPRK